MKQIVIDLLKKELKDKLSEEEITNLVEVPQSQELGDYAFPCFSLAKQLKKSPLLIAEELTEKLRKKLPLQISNVDFKSAYVNFFLNKKIFSDKILVDAVKEDYGKLNIGKKKIGIEYPSPNTNKALHVGHLRNIAIGESVSKICENAGNKIFHLNLFNDRGILISKSMIGYEKYGKGKEPKENGDEFVGDFYVKFSKESKDKPELEELAKEKLRLWESGDKDTINLWKKMNSWFYQGFEGLMEEVGLSKIDKSYLESELYLKGKSIVEEGLKKGVFKKEKDDSVIIDLTQYKLGEKVLTRSDGTALYMTTDLYLAKKKIEDFKLHSSYYVLGSDQEYHFNVLFKILELLGIKKDWRHLSYGMVTLPEGKMKSREGTAVSARGLLNNTKEMAKESLKKRAKLSKEELEKRSLIIALSAIKYHLLKVDYKKNIIFNPNEALAFEGDTGPYLLYTYARATSIINKKKARASPKTAEISPEETALITKISQFPDITKKAYEQLAPNLLANYSFELAQLFNEFYHKHPVIGSEEEALRLKITDATRKTLKKSLALLGIDVLEEM